MTSVVALTCLAGAQGVVFGLVGIGVRLQWALFRGFDLVVAVCVLAAAETLVALSAMGGEGKFTAVGAALGAVLTSVILLAVWNAGIERWFGHLPRLGSFLFVASLGISTAAIGLVGLLRGGGVRAVEIDFGPGLTVLGGTLGTRAMLAFLVGGALLAGVARWRRSRSGLAADLLSQNADFARELGVERGRIGMATGAVAGACCGVAGCYLASVGGSTPELGLPTFLYGAGAAFLLPGRSILTPLRGGMILGIAHVGLQLLIEPALSSALLFAGVVVVLVFRGTSRTALGLR